MLIKSKTQLQVGRKYWYISVPQCCHFNNLKVKEDIFKGGQNQGMNATSVYGMIIFDSKAEADNYLKTIKAMTNNMIIQ